MVVEDAHVGGGAVARLDGDVVVSGADKGVGDGDVAGLRGVDAVGVARGAGLSILTAQTVRPSPRWKEMWKLGEFLRVMR